MTGSRRIISIARDSRATVALKQNTVQHTAVVGVRLAGQMRVIRVELESGCDPTQPTADVHVNPGIGFGVVYKIHTV
jgi:hypothetical protein